jgi:hypothetical protein
MNRFSQLAAVVSLLLSNVAVAEAQDADRGPSPDSNRRADYLLPKGGEFSASFATGIPFLGIGELAYGVGDGFAVGAIAAATPDVGSVQGAAAVGVRPRGVVFRVGSWRSVLVAPVLYYPSIQGFGRRRDPWVLTRPELTLERRLDSGVRVNLGLGVIAAACTESLMTLGNEHSSSVMGGVWNTVRIGAGVPISERTSLFGEASLVMRGVLPARDWIGVAPAIAIVGVAASL